MVRIRNKMTTLWLLGAIASIIGSAALLAQKIVDPQIIAQQEEIQKLARESGYGDIEIDMLHRDISKLIGELLVPKLAYDDPEQDRPWDLNVKPGEEFILKIAQGESIKAISERYIYDGDLYLQADNAGKLQKVEFRFTRTNPLGYRYKEERRDLVNPSPNFTPEENPDTVDRNDDITLTYYEMKDEQTEFKKISEFTLKDIQYFDKQMMIIDAYKKYLRRARKRLEQSVYDRKLREKIRVRHMLSFE